MLYDVFICHASEDKEDFVRPLAERLRAHHIEVWFDEFVLTVGDSLREAIDRGLAQSKFGVVVLSPAFFGKRWPQRELSGLVAREVTEGRSVVLPIWHQIGKTEILRHSPPLADLMSVSSDRGIDGVVNELLKRLRPEQSPLVTARDFLLSKGIKPPIVTDEWWLGIVEAKEALLRFPEPGVRRWIYPLPFPEVTSSVELGLQIGWTALQLDWSIDGEERNLCQLTHPEHIYSFLRKWPGLFECSLANPAILAMYAPQLTIPGFDDGFAQVFDELLDPSRTDAYALNWYSRPDTIDGKDPLCGELIAWRHPTFGNYTDRELAYSFVRAHDSHYSRNLYNIFECTIWLLSCDSDWMPKHLRATLVDGMRKRDLWFRDVMLAGNAFSDALLRHSRDRFKYTRRTRAAMEDLITSAVTKLGIVDKPISIAERFMKRGFVEGYYDYQDEIREKRERNM